MAFNEWHGFRYCNTSVFKTEGTEMNAGNLGGPLMRSLCAAGLIAGAARERGRAGVATVFRRGESFLSDLRWRLDQRGFVLARWRGA